MVPRLKGTVAILRRRILPRPLLTPHEEWLRDGGTALIERTTSPLVSLALDFGGFKGDWSSHVRKTAPQAEIHIFEPVQSFSSEIGYRFRDDPLVHVHGVAVGLMEREETWSLASDATGLHSSGGEDVGAVRFMVAEDLRLLIGDRRVSLAKINIEGGEYELLDALDAVGLLPKIECILIQFHDFGTGEIGQRQRATETLSRTHMRTWSYPWVWERWDRVQGDVRYG